MNCRVDAIDDYNLDYDDVIDPNKNSYEVDYDRSIEEDAEEYFRTEIKIVLDETDEYVNESDFIEEYYD